MKKCIHPRKAYNLMKEFLNEISDLCYFDGDDYYKTEILLCKADEFAAECVDCVAECDELEIYYNFENLYGEGAKLFRTYWTKKVPMLKGFANITLTLLHELGHLETNDKIRQTFSVEMRKLTWFAIDNKFNNVDDKNYHYFAMPDEASATQWGIDWLSNAEHRKIAKIFEKKFLACFE